MSKDGLLFIHDHPPAMLLTSGKKTRLSMWKLMRLYACIVAAANDELGLQWWLSQDTLARRAPMRKQQVQDGLKDLQELQLIEKIGKRDRSDLWRVIIPNFETSTAIGHNGMPDSTMNGHDGMPDSRDGIGHANGHPNGHANGHPSGHANGRDGMPLTELERNQNANARARSEINAWKPSHESVLVEALRIELELIPTTKATADQLLPRKRQKWAQTITQTLARYPRASADPQNVNLLALMVLHHVHAGDARFAISPAAMHQLDAAERSQAEPALVHASATPDWAAKYRAAHFPAKFKRSKPNPTTEEEPF